MKMAYLEMSEMPDRNIEHEQFKYKLTSFSTKREPIVANKLREMMFLGYEPVAVKFEEKFYIYVKVHLDLPQTTSDVSDTASEQDTGIGESVGEEENK